MKKEEIFKNLFDAVVKIDEQKGKDAATLLIKENYDPLEGIENGLSKGMKVVGEKFNKFEIYLPELMMAARVFDSAMAILKPHISSDSKSTKNGQKYQKWADEIGADIYGENAERAVSFALEFMSKNQSGIS